MTNCFAKTFVEKVYHTTFFIRIFIWRMHCIYADVKTHAESGNINKPFSLGDSPRLSLRQVFLPPPPLLDESGLSLTGMPRQPGIPPLQLFSPLQTNTREV